MKKARITAVFVAVFMLITSVSCAVTVSATETTQKTAYERLGDLVGDTGYFTDYEPILGYYSPYEESNLWAEVQNANIVYRNKELTEEDYAAEVDRLLYELHNMPVFPSYVRATVGKAKTIKNTNNFYKSTDWTEFQRNLAILQGTLGNATDYLVFSDLPKCRQITAAFHALLNSYNRMTLQGFVLGDANADGKLDIKDVTAVQRCLADMAELSTAQTMRAAVTGQDDISIADATAIQETLAEFSTKLEPAYAYIGMLPSNETEDHLYERLFNYTLCPRDFSGMGLPDYFYDTIYFQDIYRVLN